MTEHFEVYVNHALLYHYGYAIWLCLSLQDFEFVTFCRTKFCFEILVLLCLIGEVAKTTCTFKLYFERNFKIYTNAIVEVYVERYRPLDYLIYT